MSARGQAEERAGLFPVDATIIAALEPVAWPGGDGKAFQPLRRPTFVRRQSDSRPALKGNFGPTPLLSQKAISRVALDGQDGQVVLSGRGLRSAHPDFAGYATTGRGLVVSPPDAFGRFPGVK